MRRRRRHPRQFRQDVVELDGIEPEIGAVGIPEVYRDQVVGAVLRPRDAVARIVEEADRVGVPLRQTLRKGPHLAQDVAAGGIPDDRGPETDRLQRPADRRHVVVRVLERAADLGVIGRIADQQRQTQLRVRLLTRCADPDRQRYRGRCNYFHLRPTPQGPKSPARYHAPSPGKSRCGIRHASRSSVSGRYPGASTGPILFAERQCGVKKPGSILALRCAGPRR